MAGGFPTLLLLLAAPSYGWGPSKTAAPLSERVPPPAGFHRVELEAGSFGAWLRAMPTREGRPPVHLFDGRLKRNQAAQFLVFDIDVGARDLQQCADAVIRLRAEYLFSVARHDDICFRFTSGDPVAWKRWAAGERPVVRGRKVAWTTAPASQSHENFRRYLDALFMYAGSASLSRELRSGIEMADIQPGDVFIQGGFPGHAVIVMDVAQNGRGERVYLLAQSYMPAQEIHLLVHPGRDDPWYPARRAGALETPEWTFQPSDLRRFDEKGCPVHSEPKAQ